MVAGLEAELRGLADLAHQLVLGAGRGGRVGQVGQRRQRRLQLLFDCAQLALELLGARGHSAHRRDLALALLPVARGLDARVGLVLLGAQPLQLGQQLAPARIQLDHPTQAGGRLLAATRERRAHDLRLGGSLEVEHDRRFRSRRTLREVSRALPGPRYFVESVMFTVGTFCACSPEYFARKAGDFARFGAEDDVLRHDRAREAAVVDRVEHLFGVLLAEVEVRAVRRAGGS